jgi:hypothetical protein
MTLEQYCKAIIEEAAHLNLSKILLSSELLFFIPFDQIRRLREIFTDVRLVIICYIRRIDSFLPSFLHQGIKAQGIITDDCNYDEIERLPYVKNIISSVANRLKAWLHEFPKENIIIRPYEKKQFYRENIFWDFLDIMSVRSISAFDLPKSENYARLTRDALEYKRLLNRIFENKPEKTTPFINPLLRYSASIDNSTTNSFSTNKNLISPKIRYDAYIKNEAFYNRLATEYLNRLDGKLFYDPPPDPSEFWEPYNGLQEEEAQRITKFLHHNYPGLVRSIHKELIAIRNRSDHHLNDAKRILLPPLKKVLGIQKKARVNNKSMIYLHFGTAKTGTSAIQHFICNNLDLLKKFGYYYPKTGRVNDCHHGIAFYWGDHNAFKKKFNIKRDMISRLYDELQQYQNNNIIISSECLLMQTVNLNEFFNILPHKNIRIIIYFRRQDYFITARYRELVKGNQIILTPSEWIEQNTFPNEYLGILNKLSRYIDRKNIIVKVYEKEQFVKGTLFSDFLDIFNMKLTEEFVVSKKNFNPHLSRDALEFNRLVNTVFSSQNSPYLFSGMLTQYSLKNESDDKFKFKSDSLFSPHRRMEIYNRCKPVNTKIAREYLKRENGKLFFAPPPDLNETWEPYPGLSKEKAEDIAMYLFKNNRQLTDKLYSKLQKASPDTTYIQEAKQVLLPALSKFIETNETG